MREQILYSNERLYTLHCEANKNKPDLDDWYGILQTWEIYFKMFEPYAEISTRMTLIGDDVQLAGAIKLRSSIPFIFGFEELRDLINENAAQFNNWKIVVV